MKIKFKRDTAFRKQFFVPESFAHPAKMDAQLLIWIVEHYTEAGEMILDPMAGMGTTMLACILGRDVVLVELEEKFCKMMWDNWEQVKMRPQLGSTMGNCHIICGDARQLEGLVDKIVTSPPYSGGIDNRDRSIEPHYDEGREKKFAGGSRSSIMKPYSQSPNNIGNLPYGEIDKCIFSPPYAAALKGQDQSKYDDPEYQKKLANCPSGDYSTPGRLRALKTHEEGYSQDPSNIGNLPYGQIDKIVTSQDENMLGGLIVGEGSFFISTQRDERMKLGWQLHPRFSLCLANTPADAVLIGKIQAMLGCGKIRVRQDKRPKHQEIIEYWVYRMEDLVNKLIPLCDRIIPQSAKRVSYERWKELVFMMARGEHLTKDGLTYIKEHIGDINNHRIDSVIFSPPYEGSLNDPKDKGTWRNELDISKNLPRGYSRNEDNIGNLKSQSYLEAMLQVYQQCHKVLKPRGLMILVTKNFIRNKQVIRLDEDTIKLCEQAGFSFVERHYRELPSQSFWRVIYHNKFPDVEQILNEDVLVFQKELLNG